MDVSDEKKDDLASKLLCNGCLCMGRSLHKITEEKLVRFYRDALREIPSEMGCEQTEFPNVCWECKASLKKAATFKEQVQDCQRILQAYTNESLRECLVSDIVRSSRLHLHHNTPISIEPVTQMIEIPSSPQRDRLDTEECVFFKTELKVEYSGAVRGKIANSIELRTSLECD
ncbi:uncharacterized protein LOC114352246 [Ostrinia furnacalis]|uniref:uncharacterized protein LOC114352246 n=1 Tax=Ostrinia furnacalis TaxID=93504 RepID=UPI001039C859|nr:uncharacterized protein LOC114352246 [Ostrinia furnacalis]